MGLAQFEQPFGFASVHARVLGAPHVKRRIIETAFASDLLDRYAWLGPLQKTNDPFFAVFAGSHVHHFPY